jgi:hypothetical protein
MIRHPIRSDFSCDRTAGRARYAHKGALATPHNGDDCRVFAYFNGYQRQADA